MILIIAAVNEDSRRHVAKSLRAQENIFSCAFILFEIKKMITNLMEN